MKTTGGTNAKKLCQQCEFDFDISWTGICAHCDRTFNADGYTETRKMVCPSCKRPPAAVMKDEPTEICKHCLSAAVPELDARTKAQVAMRPAKVAPASSQNSSANRAGQEEQCTGTSCSNESLSSFSNELWRFMGCVCTNQEPGKFQLKQSEWRTKSYYCLNCQQPYSAFMWNNELTGKECPRCHNTRVATDPIETGDCFIECQVCNGKVSKRRFDTLNQEVAASERTKGGQSVACVHCACPRVELVVTQCDENPCVMQLCGRCGAADFLAGWNRHSDRLGLRDAAADADEGERQQQLASASETPAGFEELTQCCGQASLSSLHPVEDDPDDALLACAHCGHVVNLWHRKDTRIPMTVAALRRAASIRGRFSMGHMGRPYRTVEVKSLAELQPADQLDFKKLAYSHHAIVERPLPDSKQVAVIEYTGESNRPTVAAVLRALPNKARVQRSMLKFRDHRKTMHRVDYHSLDCFLPQAVLRRAATRINEEGYNLIASNCEHFSNWAKANVTFSRQVEAFKEMARSVLRSAVVEISDHIDGREPADGSVGAAVAILQDVRAEMLQVLDSKKGCTSLRDFWCPIRLVLKWAIRGIPLALLSREAGCKLMGHLDGLLRPVSEAVADALVPVPIDADGDGLKDEEEPLGKKKQKKV